MIGIEEAILEFAKDALLPEDGETPLNDPRNENFFHRRQPVRPPSRAPKEEPEPPTEALPDGDDLKTKESRREPDSSPPEQALFDSFWEQFSDEDLWLPTSSATPVRSIPGASMLLFASLLVTQVPRSGSAKRSKAGQTDLPSHPHRNNNK